MKIIDTLVNNEDTCNNSCIPFLQVYKNKTRLLCGSVRVFYLHDQLMGAGHQGEAVGVVEGFRDVLSEGVAGTSGGDTPPTTIIRVRPQQVTHRSLRERDTIILQCTTSFFHFVKYQHHVAMHN